MSYTISEVNPLCPDGTPRVGWVSYLVTLGDGRYARTGVWVNGDYSVEPTVNADGTARALSGGVYSGWDAPSTAPFDPSVWWDFSPTLAGDSAALAEIAGTATDPAVTSAVASALSGQPDYRYGTAASASPSSASITGAGAGFPVGVTVTSPAGPSGAAVFEPFTWVSSDPSVATAADTSSGGSVSCLVTEAGPGTCTVTGTSGSRAAPSFAVSVPVTCS